jgi:hypothetical protein
VSKSKILHLCRKWKNAYGGYTTTSFCGRVATVSDGMNLTDKAEEVTCSYCKRILKATEGASS